MTAASIPDTILKKLLVGPALPALPQSAVRILELLKDPDCGPDVLAVPLESDPGLVSQVLRFVNSSYFGFAREIASVRAAITLVGVQTVQNFVLWSAVFSSVPDPKSGSYHFRRAWYDSLYRAVFARSLAKLLHVAAEEAFCAALLQDVAVPLLIKAEPKAYQEILQTRQQTGRRLSDLERERFGWTHGDAARVVCHQWNLPEPLTEMISRHLETERLDQPGAETDALGAVILSGLLPSSVDTDWSEEPLFEQSYVRLAPPGAPASQDFLHDVEGQLKKLLPLAGFAADTPMLNRRPVGPVCALA
jgi:HD-like signal output (HDOD) protein